MVVKGTFRVVKGTDVPALVMPAPVFFFSGDSGAHPFFLGIFSGGVAKSKFSVPLLVSLVLVGLLPLQEFPALFLKRLFWLFFFKVLAYFTFEF